MAARDLSPEEIISRTLPAVSSAGTRFHFAWAAKKRSHCASAMGWEATERMSSREAPGRAMSCISIGKMVSATMASWLSRSRSNRSEEHTSELQSRRDLVCRLLLEKKKKKKKQKKQ